MKSHYETLKIDNTADARQIKRAYFELVKQFPPERFPEEFKEIRAAYDALSDEETRAKYDEAATIPQEVAFLFGQADKARKQGRYEDAAEIYKIMLDSHPELSVVRFEQARTFETIGKTGKAIEAWEILCAREPNNVKYIVALADCYDMRGWRKKAIGAYNRAIEMDDSNPECWESLLDCHLSASEFEDAAVISLRAVEALEDKGKESIYVYSRAAAYGARGDFGKIEGFLKDIVRLARTGKPAVSEIKGVIWYLLSLFEIMELIRFYPYISEIADTLTSVDENMSRTLEKAELSYEIETLKKNGFSSLFHTIFMILNSECDCDECRKNMVALEYTILVEIDKYRPQLLRLRNEYKQLYELHSEFFNEAIRTRDLDKMIYKRMKVLDRLGYFSDEDSDRDEDDPPIQQTVRREGPKIGRNDPCPCGSGKKYKKCCGA